MIRILRVSCVGRGQGEKLPVAKVRILFLPFLFLLLWACSDDDPIVPDEHEYTCIFWACAGDRTIERAIFEGDLLVDQRVIYQGDWETAPSEIVADADARLLYWTDFETGQILRTSWNGDESPDILYTASGAGGGPIGLALDVQAQQLYWTKPYEDLIARAPANGNGPVDTLFTSDDGINGAWGLTISVADGYLYWVEYRDAELFRVPVDLSAAPDLLYAGGSGFLRPYGLAVGENTNSLFIVDNPLPGTAKPDRLLRGSTDGNEHLQELYTSGEVSNAYNMVVVPEDNAIYWLNQLNSGAVYRGSMDGTSPAQLLINNINIGEGLAVVRVQSQEGLLF